MTAESTVLVSKSRGLVSVGEVGPGKQRSSSALYEQVLETERLVLTTGNGAVSCAWN